MPTVTRCLKAAKEAATKVKSAKLSVKRLTKPHGTITRQAKVHTDPPVIAFDSQNAAREAAQIPVYHRFEGTPKGASRSVPVHVVSSALADQLVSYIKPKGSIIFEQGLGTGLITQSLLHYGAKKVVSFASVAPAFAFQWKYYDMLKAAYPDRLDLSSTRLDKWKRAGGSENVFGDNVTSLLPIRKWSDPCHSAKLVFMSTGLNGNSAVLFLLHQMGTKQGVFKHGRLPLYMLLPKPLARQLLQQGKVNHRLGYMAHFCADVQELAAFPRQVFAPAVRPSLQPHLSMHLFKITPKPGDWTALDFGYYDYLIQKLAIYHNQILGRIPCLGPGARDLLEPAGIDPNTSCSRLTARQFMALAKVYQEWDGLPEAAKLDVEANVAIGSQASKRDKSLS
eukprot:TRINITY_DN9243_c0_g1_i4.p1 TRINITY_DN9243_c0_g1~~TRINITY_DN9243_c0_g1_i4.p1  ORF type:complete len:394 (+),score=54.46 TRINITY_DN9243_c0_g1_i4:193-1374(+)